MQNVLIQNDTIAAVATPQGRGGISIIKISGPLALDLAESIIKSSKNPAVHPREMVYGKIIDGETTIDEALVCYMKSPRSYTGEDVVEIQTHGGRAAAAATLDLLIRKGARPASPGEFTRRAFLNGKIDLAQAEAVEQITSAESAAALQCAERMLEGSFSRKINGFIDAVTAARTALEMEIDFSDQGDENRRRNDIPASIQSVLRDIDAMLLTYRRGQYIRNGFRTVIAGKVNVGKSSLFNALLGKPRAIVNGKPGTTRDWIEEKIEIAGLLFSLVDTAGLRKTHDDIEKEGVTSSERLISNADIILHVLEPDDTESPPADLRRIIVFNKADLLESRPEKPGCLYTSALTGEGVEECRNQLVKTALACINHSEISGVLLLERHRNHLENARNALNRAISSFDSWSEEIIAMELNDAHRELASILGLNSAPDILDAIFKNFCIGK